MQDTWYMYTSVIYNPLLTLTKEYTMNAVQILLTTSTSAGKN